MTEAQGLFSSASNGSYNFVTKMSDRGTKHPWTATTKIHLSSCFFLVQFHFLISCSAVPGMAGRDARDVPEPCSDGNRYSIENRELKSAIEPSEADLGRHHLIDHTIVFV